MNVNQQFVPPFPGVDYSGERSLINGAVISDNIRRNTGPLQGIYGEGLGPFNHASLVAGNLKTLYNERYDGGVDEIIFGSDFIQINGQRAKKYKNAPGDADTTFSYTPVAISCSKMNGRIYFVDGNGPLRYINEEDLRVYEIVPLDIPDDATYTLTNSESDVIDNFDSLVLPYPLEWGTMGTNDHSGFNSVAVDPTSPIGNHIRVNTAGNLQKGCQIQRIIPGGSELDFSGVNAVQFFVYSDDNERATGDFLAFYFISNKAGGGTVKTYKVFDIQSSKTKFRIEVDLSDVPDEDKNDIFEYGFEWNYSRQSVVIFSSLTTNIGKRGEFDYVYTNTSKIGYGDNQRIIESRESSVLHVDTGDGRMAIAVSVGPPVGVPKDPGVTHYRLYIKERTVDTRYLFAKEVAAPATGPVVINDDIRRINLEGPLNEGRSNPPIGSTRLGQHKLRLVVNEPVYKGRMRISDILDDTTFLDATVNQAVNFNFDAVNGVMIDIGEEIEAIVPVSVTTGTEIVGDTIILTQENMILLRGDSPQTFDVSRRVEGGIAGPEAYCYNDSGTLIYVCPSGEIFSVGRDVERQNIASNIQPRLNKIGSKESWKLEYDRTIRHIVLFTGNFTDYGKTFNAFTLDVDTMNPSVSPWDTLSGMTAPSTMCKYSQGDESYVVIGHGNGLTKRLFHPDSPKKNWTYRTKAVAIGTRSICEKVVGRAQGEVSIQLLGDYSKGNHTVFLLGPVTGRLPDVDNGKSGASPATIGEGDGSDEHNQQFRVFPSQNEFVTFMMELSGEGSAKFLDGRCNFIVRGEI